MSETLDLWRQWRSWLRVVGSADTARTYSKAVLGFFAETGCKPIADYTEQDVVAYLDDHASRGKAKHDVLKALRSIFRYCADRLVIAIDPTALVKVKKPRRKPAVTLSEEELVRLLVAAVNVWGERVGWAILLTYLLGLRRMEVAAIRWSDIREGETGPVLEIPVTKGAEGGRDPLPLSALALECLGRLAELPAPAQARLGPEYVLRVQRATVSRWVHDAAVAAGLDRKKTGSHRLRASLATNLRDAGVNVSVVQQVLGHLRLESTAWYFARVTERDLRSALELPGHGGGERVSA